MSDLGGTVVKNQIFLSSHTLINFFVRYFNDPALCALDLANFDKESDQRPHYQSVTWLNPSPVAFNPCYQSGFLELEFLMT